MNQHFKTAWKYIRRSPYQAVAAIATMSLTFFVAAIFFVSAVGSQVVLSYFEKRPQITAFFSDTKSATDIQALGEKLKGSGKVEAVKYISKEEALEIYRDQNQNDPLLLEMVTADILPASLEVSAYDPKSLNELADVLRNETGVEDVVYQKDVVDTLISWTQVLRATGFILVSVLLYVSLLVLLTVIGMKIALKKKEIQILRLLGAGDWYIRWPFLFEGGFYGVLAAIFSWTVLYLLILYATPFLTAFLAGVPILPVSAIFMLLLFFGMLIVGFAVGAFGSFLALIRYL